MKHEIDLKNYEIRTDLAIESVDGYKISKKPKIEKEEEITITSIILNEEEGQLVGKKAGNYITIEFEDVTDYTNKEKLQDIFGKYLKQLLELSSIKESAEGLLIGLGNSNSTPDALGPMTISNVLVTRHLDQLGQMEEGFRVVSAINTGVMGETGIETVSIIKGVVEEVKPDFVITIDALKSSSIDRVNKTIQMTDTGIHPGSGVGNKRKEISKETLGIPVIAIGVPTVVDLVTVVSDTVGFMEKKFSYEKSSMKKPSNKLKAPNSENYLKKEIEVKKEDRVHLLGMLGMLSPFEQKQFFYEVLSPIGYNMIVTPKEIDFLIEKLSEVIGNGINRALHEKVA